VIETLGTVDNSNFDYYNCLDCTHDKGLACYMVGVGVGVGTMFV
jgi:hypothetical protein